MNKTILSRLVIFSFVIFVSCGTGKGKTTLDISWRLEPQGGTSVVLLNARAWVEKKFIDQSTVFQSESDPKDITVRAEWWWRSGNKTSTEMVGFNTYEISGGSGLTTIRESYEAPEGFILANYYYLILKWTDDEGYHELKSREVFCSVPESNSNLMDEIQFHENDFTIQTKTKKHKNEVFK
ncbi:MAG: hypothetical protein ROO71_02835 [Balneola sp.]